MACRTSCSVVCAIEFSIVKRHELRQCTGVKQFVVDVVLAFVPALTRATEANVTR